MSEGSETARTYVGSVKIGRRKSTEATTPLTKKPEKKHGFRAMAERLIEDPQKRERIIKGTLALAGTSTLAKAAGAVSDLLTPPTNNAPTVDQPQQDMAVKNNPPDISHIREAEIAKQYEAYKNDKDRAKNTLYWKDTVTAVVKSFGIKQEDQEFWVNRMLEIIFVESEGNPTADPANWIKDPVLRAKAKKTSAKGLTQILPKTAAELADRYEIEDYDLLNPWNNIFLGLAYQLNMARSFGTELGAWAHHLGYGNLDQALESYITLEVGLPIYDKQLRLEYIKKYDIDPFRLLHSDVVINKLREINALNDDTEHYYAKLKGGGRCMKLPDLVKHQTRA